MLDQQLVLHKSLFIISWLFVPHQHFLLYLQFKFGDIISFERKCPCLDFTIYKHYAIFVGDADVFGRSEGEDIFHHVGMYDSNLKQMCEGNSKNLWLTVM